MDRIYSWNKRQITPRRGGVVAGTGYVRKRLLLTEKGRARINRDFEKILAHSVKCGARHIYVHAGWWVNAHEPTYSVTIFAYRNEPID